MNLIKLKQATLLLFTLYLYGSSFAFHTEFQYLQPRDGLNDGEVNDIVQDQNGLMWFATWTGIFSYDGYELKQYRPELGNPSTLPDKKIKSLFVDDKNHLWIVTSKYLCRYVKSTDSFVTYGFENGPASGMVINGVAQIDNNLVIHVVDGFYLLPFNNINDPGIKAKRLSLYQSGHLASNYYACVTSMNNQLILTANDFQQQNSSAYLGSLTRKGKDTIIEIKKLVDLPYHTRVMNYTKQQKRLYFGTQKGIFIYSTEQNKLLQKRLFSNHDIRQIVYATNNHLYASSIDPELLYIDLHTGKTDKYVSNPYQYGTLLNSRIHSLFEDFSGNLWVGHQGQGISILNLNQKEFHTFRHDPFNKNSLNSNKVMCFGGTDKEIFIGLRTGGLNYMKKEFSKSEEPVFQHVELIGTTNSYFGDGVWDIEKQNENLLWVGSDVGLLMLYKVNNQWILKHYSGHDILNRTIRKVYVDDNNNLWCAAFDEGLIFIPNPVDNDEKIFYQYTADPTDDESISDNTILTIDIDSRGRFWIGTSYGLNLLKSKYQNIDLSGKSKPELKFQRYVAVKKDSNYLNNNEINCIYENYDGTIWIATQGGGINIMDTERETFTHITRDDGLPSNDVQGILPDKMGNLWISTTKGLVNYNQHQDGPKMVNYKAPDGIQGNIFMVNSYYKSVDGELFFGGDNGFTRFYPEDIKPNIIKPKTVFTEFRFGKTPVEIEDTTRVRQILQTHINETETIVLPFKHKTFSIGVSPIHYQYPRGNKVMYKLGGYDHKWITMPGYYDGIYYSNLPSGKYTLQVKSVSSDNQVSNDVKTLHIEILRPWYGKWYMIIIFVSIALFIISGLFFMIVNRQRLIYDQKIDKLTIENSESKMAFLTNIAHGLKTPLSLVIAPIDDLVNNYREIKPEWKNHLLLVQRNANYLLKLINQIIDFRKLHAGKLKMYIQKTDIVKIVKDVVANFKSFENSQHVKLFLDIPFDSFIISIDAQKIEEVFYNLISNAFKHTPKKHHITISMRTVNPGENGNVSHTLKITVFNEGPVVDAKDKSKIFERFYKVDEKLEGAGIGLSFSKSLIEMHKGSIEVEPVADKGMAFHVLLPYIEYAEEEKIDEYHNDIVYETEHLDDLELLNKIPENLALTDEKQLKIVLVEDNEELRGFLKNVLSKNYACYEASNGQEGIDLTRKIIPDIVISDIIMPEKDGYQLCREIKNSGKTCHIPVILLTAKNTQDQIISGYEVGADAYVTKPFDLNIISSQISRLIKNRELIRKKYQDQNFMIEVVDKNLSKDDEFILNFRNALEKNIADPNYNVKSLAKSLNVSSTQLYRKIKALTGYSPVEFIRIVKLQKSYELLLQRNNSVKEVCYISGFNNISYFIKCFRDHFGITPASLKEKGSVVDENAG